MKTFKIGKQEWMTQNLDNDAFLNGDLIGHAQTAKDWVDAGLNEQPAWTYYDDNENIGIKYGKLYNWFAINDSRGLAPKGFHIPNNIDWIELITSYGDIYVAGDEMRYLKDWDEKWFGTDIEGFSCLPAGYRANGAGGLVKNADGTPLMHTAFYDIGKSCYLWSASSEDNSKAWCYYLTSDNVELVSYPWYKGMGFSIRCVRDY